MNSSENSIFNEEFLNMGEGNPLEGMTLSEKDNKKLLEITGVLDKQREQKLKDMEEELSKMKLESSRHEMTGLVKWRSEYGKEETAILLDLAGRNKIDVWLADVDYDYLHYLNKTYGMPTVDKAIICLTKAMSESLRDSDLLLQYGSDEFPVFMPDISKENIKLVFERITSNYEKNLDEAVNSGLIPSELAKEATFTASVTKMSPKNTYADGSVSYEEPDLAYERAGKILADTKERGRNRLFIEGINQDFELRQNAGIEAKKVLESGKEFEERYK